MSKADACPTLDLFDEPAPPAKTSRTPRFNRTSDEAIGWCWWTWNPVTGCRGGCPFCYARELALREDMRRYYPRGFEPDLHRDRLAAPQHTRVPAEAVTTPAADLVFTVSMGDLLGVGVPDEWVEEVLAAIRAAPWWRFCVLTKQPARLAGFQWPSNAWLGSTLTGDVTTPDPIARAEALGAVEVPVRFVSFEPLLGPVPEAVLDAGRVSWVIVGGRSPANGLPRAYPPADVLADLLRACDRRGLPVFEKTNLRPTGAARRTEWPRGCEAV